MRIFILFFLSVFISCETIVHPDLPKDAEKLVVYSFFSPNQPIRFDVFNSVFILNRTSMIPAKGLHIDLYEADKLVESISEDISGIYMGETFAKPNTAYRIEIATPNGKLISHSTVPNAIDIKEVTFSSDIEDINLGEYGYPASVTFTDPINEDNYYSLEVFVDECVNGCDELGITGELNELLFEDVKVNTSGTTNISIVEGPEGIDGVKYIYIADNGFNGQTLTIDFFIIPTLIDPEMSSEVIIKYVLKSITSDYYNYLLTSDYQKQIEEEGTLAEPVQVFSNVKNGLGVFAGYNTSMHTLTVPD